MYNSYCAYTVHARGNMQCARDSVTHTRKLPRTAQEPRTSDCRSSSPAVEPAHLAVPGEVFLARSVVVCDDGPLEVIQSRLLVGICPVDLPGIRRWHVNAEVRHTVRVDDVFHPGTAPIANVLARVLARKLLEVGHLAPVH